MRHALIVAALAAITLAPPASAEAKAGVDGLMSNVMQEHQSSISGFGIRGRFQSQLLVDNVTFMPTIEWWRSASHVDPYGIDTERVDNTLGLDVAYRFPVHDMIPYGGLGFAAHFMSSKVNAPMLGVYNAEKTVTKGGLTALIGVAFPLTTSVQNFLELKYHHITDYRELKLSWGIGFDF
jgi:opacity protein-like surface antigen